MKNMYLILSMLFLFTGCNEEEAKQEEDIVTENAVVYYDSSAIDNCVYTIKTESNNFYTVESLDEIFRENNLMIKISYTVTDEKLNCGFSNNLTIIKIETIEKI